MKEIIAGYRTAGSSLRGILKGLPSVLLNLTRFSQGCESLEQRRSSCRITISTKFTQCLWFYEKAKNLQLNGLLRAD